MSRADARLALRVFVTPNCRFERAIALSTLRDGSIQHDRRDDRTMQNQLEAAKRPTPAAGRAPNAVEKRVLELIEESKSHAIPSEVLLPLYRELESIPIEFLISTWHGSVFNGQPTQGWWGKNMISADHVQPLLFKREDGSVYSNEVWGLAKLIEGEVYGLPKTVTLVYNDKPLKDYFRRVTDQTVIGLTPGALVGGPDFFFQLTRDNSTKVVP